MNFWFYENWTADDKAVIHNEDCGFCNHGHGCHDNSLGDQNGRWVGPFQTREDAREAAQVTGRDVREHD